MSADVHFFTAVDIPDFPPHDPLDDAAEVNWPRLVEPAPVLDPALRNGRGANPGNVYIAPKKRWFT